MKRKKTRFKFAQRKSKSKRVFRPCVKVESDSGWPFPKKVCGPDQYIQKTTT